MGGEKRDGDVIWRHGGMAHTDIEGTGGCLADA